MSKLLNILGLFSNLGGVLLLFVFGMPVRVETGGTTVTWTTSSINYQIRRFDDINQVIATAARSTGRGTRTARNRSR